MSSQNIRRLLLALTSLALLRCSLLAQDQGREFRWTGKLAADQVVEIKNVNGVIEAQPATGDTIEVTAEKIGPDADQIKIEVVPHNEGVTICAIYPGGAFGISSGPCEPGDKWHSESHGHNNVRVNFSVRLPQNLRFAANNINGNVQAEDLGRSVRASSVNGSIRVSTKSWVEASSVNGSVEARMGTADWTGTLKISTVNGSINLEMPSNLDADVRFQSVNGRLETQFPLTVSGSIGARKAEGRIGNGGRELVIHTVNGNVSLRHESI